MTILSALILSVIEGITEFLPISSTGHLILASKLLNIPQTEFVKSFEIYIQLGAILAVLLIYFSRLLKGRKIWLKIIISFIPTGILGLVFYKVVKHYLLGNVFVTVVSLFIGGIILILFEKFNHRIKQKVFTIEDLSTRKSVVIGLFQSISMIPGVSRSAASIIGGMITGLNREKAVEFAFLLAIPTMIAATGLDLTKNGFHFTTEEWMLLGVGFIGSFITAWITVKIFLQYVRTHTFVFFGVYRIIIAIIFLFFIR